MMLRACKYCGRIHEIKYICEKKPISERGSKIDKFRWTQAWKDKREQIKKRDLYLCQCCLNNIRPVRESRLMQEGLSVHHIQSLKTNWDKRLDDDNLITLCAEHHELAENGRISATTLKKLIPPCV